jgi:hypothetical protein
MRAFEAGAAGASLNGVSASLKVRVTSGCFHREHSPHAYTLIDAHLASIPRGDWVFDFVEHESGPEILVSLALATAGVGLVKSVVDLIIAIIQARRTGIDQGDSPSEPVELIARRFDHAGTLREEVVLHIDHAQFLQYEEIEGAAAGDVGEQLADHALGGLGLLIRHRHLVLIWRTSVK